jgi:hypothetical protein
MGDIITRFAHRPIKSDRDLQRLINSAGSDSVVTVDFMRNNKGMKIKITLTSVPYGYEVDYASGRTGGANRQDLLALQLQRRIDSMQTEMRRIQKEIERLLGLVRSAR